MHGVSPVRDGLLVENYGVFNPAKSRIKVFEFHETGRKVPYTCTQCDEAWCLHACPVEAIKVDAATGAKVVLEDVCVGCKVCTIACPFGTINYVQDTGKVQKCDLCGDHPACVDACPTAAITYVDADWTGLERMRRWAGQARQPTARLTEDRIMAWHRKLLRVNLTKGTCTPEALNMQWAQDFLGQRGLATKYFCEEVDPKVDPLSPANKLIFATGPLTGTMASTSARYSVITKGPLTGAIACSNSGGYFGAELRFAGWDMIVFEGKSPKPVYLHIENDKAELVPADDIWGKSVWDTEAILKKKHQDPLIRVSSIGRAGEAQVLFAAVVNDLHRAAGRSGVGAVMGSKNLKAIAVRGTKGVGTVKDPAAFMKAAGAAKKVLADNAVTGQGLPKFGTQVLMNVINEIGALPTRNHRDVQFEKANKISAEAMHEKRPTDGKANLVNNQACFGCTIACGRISRIDQTHYTVVNKPEYWGASGGLEYEAAWALGAATGVGDLEALTYANFVCNEDGIDPISFGATVGAAMELYDLGLIKESDVGFPADLRFAPRC